MNSSVVNTKVYRQVLHAVQGPMGGNVGYRFINQVGKTGTNKVSLTAKEIAAGIESATRKKAASELANMANNVNKTIINKPPITVGKKAIADSINRAKEYKKAMHITKDSKINPFSEIGNSRPNKVIQSLPKQQASPNTFGTQYTQSYIPKYDNNILKGTEKVIKAKDTISDINPMESFVKTQMYLNKQNNGSIIKSQNIINDNNREILKQQFIQQMNYKYNQQFNK